MAARSAAITATGVSAAVLATSVPMVLATEVLMKAPRKLSAAAIPIATSGGNTRVEMLVATALAVSWKPLVNSNDNATRTVRIRKTRPPVVPGAAAMAPSAGGERGSNI